MTGQRIVNDHSYVCDNLCTKAVEYFYAFYSDEAKSDVLMLVLKLQGIELYQRFFLDAGLGFWEAWDEEGTFCDLDDLARDDLGKSLDLVGKKVSSIICRGDPEQFSCVEFTFEDTGLLLKYSDNSDLVSDIVLEAKISDQRSASYVTPTSRYLNSQQG